MLVAFPSWRTSVLLCQGLLGFAIGPGFDGRAGKSSPFYGCYSQYDPSLPGAVSILEYAPSNYVA